MTLLKQMNWLNVQHNRPKHHQLVLACVNGIYYVTKYDEQTNQFLLQNDPGLYFSPDQQPIYWTEFNDIKDLEN